MHIRIIICTPAIVIWVHNLYDNLLVSFSYPLMFGVCCLRHISSLEWLHSLCNGDHNKLYNSRSSAINSIGYLLEVASYTNF